MMMMMMMMMMNTVRITKRSTAPINNCPAKADQPNQQASHTSRDKFVCSAMVKNVTNINQSVNQNF